MAHATYLTSDEYVTAGGTLSDTPFARLEHLARKRIDYLTDSRVQRMSAIPSAVKLCMVALINLEKTLGAEAQASNPTVTSFTTDGYSESYEGAITAENAAKRFNSIVFDYLYGELDDNGVPLLFRGVGCP